MRYQTNYHKFLLFFLVIVAAVVRIYFGFNLPFSGDELGVGVLQATGQASTYYESVPKKNVSIDEIKKYIIYSSDYGIKSVLISLRDAGMHPPFYYLLLHYIIKYLGNAVIVLRSLSILFSLFSMLIIYQLGKTVYNESLGLLSALFLAISPYCLQYSVMVRPYPLLMFLALTSTLQAYLLVKNQLINFHNIHFYLYVITCLIGMYTMYHFIFIIFSQLLFIFLSFSKDWKTISKIVAIPIIISILYIPWIAFLKAQLNVVNNHDYYFHGHYNIVLPIIKSLKQFFLIFFLKRYFSEFNLYIILILSLIIVAIFIMGSIKFLKSDNNKYFIISLCSYLFIHYAGDWLLKTKTLTIEKFMFFLVPMLFFILSFGIISMPRRFYIKIITLLLCVLMLIPGLVYVYQLKSNFDGPGYINVLGKLISDNSDNRNDKKLIIINTKERRFLLPFIYEIKDPADIVILSENDIHSGLAKINNIQQYRYIFIANLYVEYQEKPQYSENDLKLMTNYLIQNNFKQIKLLINNTNNVSLTSFKS